MKNCRVQRKIIEDHKIQVHNKQGTFFQGTDMVFFFLQEGTNKDEIVCALLNLKKDKRFNDKDGMRNAAGNAVEAYAVERWSACYHPESKALI